jgi:hypothetical protein
MQETCERVFPLIGDETSGSALGRAIARLATLPLGVVGRLTGWGLNDQARVSRMLYFHQLAIASELSGKTAAADLFFRDSRRKLILLRDKPEPWRTCVETLGGSAADADRVLQRLVREIFIEVHLAFRQGYLECEPVTEPQSRAYKHLDYVSALIGLSDLSETESLSILGDASTSRTEAYCSRGNWNAAKTAAKDLLQRFPLQSRFQDLLVAVIRGEALAGSQGGKTKQGAAAEAARLVKQIYELKKFRADFPHNLAAFGALAELHLRHADALDRAKQLPEALAEIQAALVHQPGPEWPLAAEAERKRSELESEMQQLRVQASTPDSELPHMSKRGLEGLRKQASRGFRLMESFKRSDEARAAEEDLLAAQARGVWEEIGLPPLERADLRPLTLLDALSAVLHGPPPAPSGIGAAWEVVSRDNPDLLGLDKTRIESWLTCRIFGHGPAIAAPSLPLEMDFPAIKTVRPAGGREPFWYWLCGAENIGLKALCAAALVLAMVASGFAGLEFHNRQERNDAYMRMQAARESANYSAMLDAAEQFLGHPILSRDSRSPEIEQLYSEALVRWFNETRPSPSESKLRTDRYRKLSGFHPEENRP